MLSALKIFSVGSRFLSPSVKEMAKNAGSELWISAGSQHGAFFNLVAHSGYGKGEERWRGLVESGDLKHGRVILIFEGPVLRNVLPLLWQSLGRAERVRNNTSRGRTEDSSGCCQEWQGLSASLPVTCRGSSSYGSEYAYSLKGRYRFGAGFLQDAWF